MQLLYRGVEYGLETPSDDPSQAAGDEVMRLAVSRPIDTPQTDLLGLADHTAALADMIVWILRPGEAWERMTSCVVGGEQWSASAYVHSSGLRRIVLCDRWDEERLIQEAHDWRTLEGTIYGLPMTLYIIVLGASRNGRRHGPLSKGWLHPVNQTLRFNKRDDTDFSDSWVSTFRENYLGTQEEWLESMIEDGVLTDCVRTHELAVPDEAYREDIRKLAARKLARIRTQAEIPDPQLSQCDGPISPCQFSSCCPYSRMPSERNGFILLE